MGSGAKRGGGEKKGIGGSRRGGEKKKEEGDKRSEWISRMSLLLICQISLSNKKKGG